MSGSHGGTGDFGAGRIRTLGMHFIEPRTEGRASHASGWKERLLQQPDLTLRAALGLRHREHTGRSQALAEAHHLCSPGVLGGAAGNLGASAGGAEDAVWKQHTPGLGLHVGSAQVPTHSFKSLLRPHYSLVSRKNAGPPTPTRSVRCISDLCRLATSPA